MLHVHHSTMSVIGPECGTPSTVALIFCTGVGSAIYFPFALSPRKAKWQKTGWTTFDPASQPYGPDEVRKERELYGNRVGMR
jgi:hypothetical protein